MFEKITYIISLICLVLGIIVFLTSLFYIFYNVKTKKEYRSK
jgi:hypothetical protein